ncbi:MAG: sulfotransferase family protein [Actinomycetota bacterium]
MRYGWLFRTARRRANRASGERLGSLPSPPVFLVGCGRSGTTALGDVLAAHPSVRYLFEPYHLWAAMDPITDATHLYTRGYARCVLDGSHLVPKARPRFASLFLSDMLARERLLLVEKTPINAMRIGYLTALVPDARFVHIVRDGAEVARSIERVAASSYRIAFRPNYNAWWGVNSYKWTALARDGAETGHHGGELGSLATDLQRGAYEWLVSLREVDRWRPRLGPRLAEINYGRLVEDPGKTLLSLCTTLGLQADERWLIPAARSISVPARKDPKRASITLPPGMARDFNRLQERFGFRGRAFPVGSQSVV